MTLLERYFNGIGALAVRGVLVAGTLLLVAPASAAPTAATTVKSAHDTAVAVAVPTATAAATSKNAPMPVTLNRGALALVRLPAKGPEQVRVEASTPSRSAPVVSGTAESGTTIAVRPGEQLVIHDLAETSTAGKSVKLAQNVKATLRSTVVVGVSEKGTTVARQFQPFLRAVTSPLRWDAKRQRYVTTLDVGLDPLPGDADAGSVHLPVAIRFQLTGENVDDIEPREVEVTEAGVGNYKNFTVLARQFERPVRISAHSNFGDEVYEAAVDPGPPFIELGGSVPSVDGFGLGNVTISVDRRAANGEPLPSASSVQVGLTTSRGTLEPSQIVLAAQSASGTTALISSGWGKAIVSQTTADTRSSTVAVTFAFPLLKFALGLLGAVCAGALRVFTTKRVKGAGRIAIFVGCVLTGITVDILVAVGAHVAPSWLFAVIRNELAWFAVGLIAGYPGVALLSRLGEKLFDVKREAPASTSA